ncbi:MAG: hypothetical protein SVE93_07965 [Candidatus Thermoplasmatota archaeon]|nr:hypothetical protein [Candidatus Thermoplasmatota archaeon]
MVKPSNKKIAWIVRHVSSGEVSTKDAADRNPGSAPQNVATWVRIDPLALSPGVDGIQTDNLQMLMPYLDRINGGERAEEVF